MLAKRFMVIKENGNIDFIKVNEMGEPKTVREYEKRTQTQLDFATECMERFEDEFPDWAGVLEWQMIGEGDLKDWLQNQNTII